MEWIKAVDRLPGFPSDVIWRRTDNPGDVYMSTNKDGEFWQRNGLGGIGLGPKSYFLVEWLDESDFFAGDRVTAINKILVNALQGLNDDDLATLAVAIIDRLSPHRRAGILSRGWQIS